MAVRRTRMPRLPPCYVGSAPGLLYGGCHGDDEAEVFRELCQIVEEVVELYRREGRDLPPGTAGRDFLTRMQNVGREHPIAVIRAPRGRAVEPAGRLERQALDGVLEVSGLIRPAPAELLLLLVARYPPAASRPADAKALVLS